MVITITNADNSLLTILETMNKKLTKPYKIERQSLDKDCIALEESKIINQIYNNITPKRHKELESEIAKEMQNS